MPLTLTSLLVHGPVVVRLNSGASVRLAPGETSPPLPDAEVVDNAAIDKLQGRGAIEVRGQAKAGPRSRSAAKAGTDAETSDA